jgi:hypothetical protein
MQTSALVGSLYIVIIDNIYVLNHDYVDLDIVQFVSAFNTHNYRAAAPFHCCTHPLFLVDSSPVR